MQEERKLPGPQAAKELLFRCGLTVAEGAEYTVGVFEEEELIATGSLRGDMLQMLAVDPAHQGEDLTAVVVTHLVNHAMEEGRTSLHLFTKPEKAAVFGSLGFTQVACARPYAALLEWGRPGIGEYCKALAEAAGPMVPNTSAVVMNCNPFTLGHRYLAEAAAEVSGKVCLLAVEEDRSVFPFEDRLRLMREGVAHLPNVVVIPGGRYVVSSLTFPSYFTKEENLAAAQTAIDVEIFLRRIAPALGVTRRFVGTEPFSPVTEIYNRAMLERLPPAGIEVTQLPRKERGGRPISASRVRELLAQGAMEEVRPLVPDSTWAYLNSADALPALEKLHKEQERRN